MDSKQLKLNIIEAGYKAVSHLIKVAEEDIIKFDDDELAADRLKNAAAAKKLAIFDAFDILNKIESEKIALEDGERQEETYSTKRGFAERRSK